MKLTPRAVKLVAAKELTKMIKQIGMEAHTYIDDDTLDGRPVSKFETLARLVWDRALGCTVKDVKTGEEVVFHPDKGFINMIWERVEGKVAPAASNSGKEKATLSSRIKEQSKRRLNQMSKEKKE